MYDGPAELVVVLAADMSESDKEDEEEDVDEKVPFLNEAMQVYTRARKAKRAARITRSPASFGSAKQIPFYMSRSFSSIALSTILVLLLLLLKF